MLLALTEADARRPGRRPGPTGGPPCSPSSPRPCASGSTVPRGRRHGCRSTDRPTPTSWAYSTRRSRPCVRGSPGARHRHGRLAPHRHLRPRPAGPVRRHRRTARCRGARRAHGDPAHRRRHRGQRVARRVAERGRARPGAHRAAGWPGSSVATARRSDRSTVAGARSRGRRGRRRSAPPGQARALVVPGPSSDATVIEVRAQDRPGMLHELGADAAPAPASRCARPTSPRMPGRPWTPSTSPGPAAVPLPPARVAQTVAWSSTPATASDPAPTFPPDPGTFRFAAGTVPLRT